MLSDVVKICSLALSFLGEKLFLLCVMGIFFWCVSKRTAIRLFFIYIITAPVISIARVACHVPLPWTCEEESAIRVPLAASFYYGYSLPSMELACYVAVATGIFRNVRAVWVKILSIALGLVLGISLFYIQAASLLSLVISLVAGILIAVMVNIFIKETMFDQRDRISYIIGALAPVFIMVCVTMTLYYSDIVDKTGMVQSLNVIGTPLGLVISWLIDREVIDFNPRKGRRKTKVIRGMIGVVILALSYIGFGILFKNLLLGEILRDVVSIFLAFSLYPFVLKMMHRAEAEDDDRIRYNIRVR